MPTGEFQEDIFQFGQAGLGNNAQFADGALRDDAAFLEVFSYANKEQEEMFKLLKKAYIDTRYKKDYKITKKQLEYLSKRVTILLRLTKKICKVKIDIFV